MSNTIRIVLRVRADRLVGRTLSDGSAGRALGVLGITARGAQAGPGV